MAEPPLRVRRLLWFVVLWVGGVAVLGALGLAIRAAIG